MALMKWIELGKIIKPHGFKGAFVVNALSGQDSALAYVKEILIGPQPESAPSYEITESAWMPRGWKIVVKGISSDTTVNELRGASVFTERTALKKTQKGEYYVSDLIGAEVHDENGKKIGVFSGSEPLPGNRDRWWITLESGQSLAVPASKQYVAKVDVKEGVIHLQNLGKLSNG